MRGIVGIPHIARRRRRPMRPERGFHHRILPIFLGLLLVGCGAAGSPQSDIVPQASSPAPTATATLAPSPTAGSAAATAALPSPSTGATSLAQRDPVLGVT